MTQQGTARKLRKSLLQRRWIGRFGNRLHQYAYGATYSTRFNLDYQVISSWEGDLLFAEKYHSVIADNGLREKLSSLPNNDKADSQRLSAIVDSYWRRSEAITAFSPDRGIATWDKPTTHMTHDDVCAYRPQIFDGLSKQFLLKWLFRFHESVIGSDLFKRFEDKQGTYDIAHLRRDDVSRTNVITGYPCISKESYVRAFWKFGFDPVNVQWSTDDKSRKWGVGGPLDYSGKRLGNVFPTGSVPDPDGKIFFDWFPDFLRLYFARTIFRANSSFSFWAAFLSQQREKPAVVFSPRIERRVIYGHPKTLGQELDCEFEEGNHPHWVMQKNSACPDIVIN